MRKSAVLAALLVAASLLSAAPAPAQTLNLSHDLTTIDISAFDMVPDQGLSTVPSAFSYTAGIFR